MVLRVLGNALHLGSFVVIGYFAGATAGPKQRVLVAFAAIAVAAFAWLTTVAERYLGDR